MYFRMLHRAGIRVSGFNLYVGKHSQSNLNILTGYDKHLNEADDYK